MVVVLMGVSGSGKTSVGVPLAAALGGEFVEGDDYHPPANVAKMRQGIPLDDADRRPWLETLAAEIGRWLAAGRTVVLACSALKRSYRAILRGGRPEVRFVHLKGDPALIRARLAQRRGHYMPASLLDSQLATLEEPLDAIVADIDRPARGDRGRDPGRSGPDLAEAAQRQRERGIDARQAHRRAVAGEDVLLVQAPARRARDRHVDQADRLGRRCRRRARRSR